MLIPEILINSKNDKSVDEMKTDNISFLMKLMSAKRYNDFLVKSQGNKNKIVSIWLENSSVLPITSCIDGLSSNASSGSSSTALSSSALSSSVSHLHNHRSSSPFADSLHLSTSNFPTISASNTFHVRQMCASLTPHIVCQMTPKQIEETIYPRVLTLSTDNVWGVRRAMADVIPEIISKCDRKLRHEKFIDIFQSLLNDKSRWVRMTAYGKLASFILALSVDENEDVLDENGNLETQDSIESEELSQENEVSSSLSLEEEPKIIRRRRISSTESKFGQTTDDLDSNDLLGNDCLLKEEIEFKKQNSKKIGMESFGSLRESFLRGVFFLNSRIIYLLISQRCTPFFFLKIFSIFFP